MWRKPVVDAALHRTGITSPLGKLTEQIPAIKVDVETKELLEQTARSAGLTLQEFVRELLMISAHGLEKITKLHADRLAVVSGKVQES